MRNPNKIVQNVVRKLKMFGFVNVNCENIMKDEVYLFYFKKILKEKFGLSSEDDPVIEKLLHDLEDKESK